MRKYPLLADSVPNIFPTGAVGIYQNKEHYNQIAVLKDVEFREGSADVLYVATNQGNIIKMVNLQKFSKPNTDPLVKVAMFQISEV